MTKPDRLYQMKIERVPYSSVVGSALTIHADGIGVVAMLMISVPQPHLDYKTVADAISKALLTHGTSNGNITLVLSDDFKEQARKATHDK